MCVWGGGRGSEGINRYALLASLMTGLKSEGFWVECLFSVHYSLSWPSCFSPIPEEPHYYLFLNCHPFIYSLFFTFIYPPAISSLACILIFREPLLSIPSSPSSCLIFQLSFLQLFHLPYSSPDHLFTLSLTITPSFIYIYLFPITYLTLKSAFFLFLLPPPTTFFYLYPLPLLSLYLSLTPLSSYTRQMRTWTKHTLVYAPNLTSASTSQLPGSQTPS